MGGEARGAKPGFDSMSRLLGWLCYRIVMTWPGAWPIGAVAGWILAWAGDYANEPPNDQGNGPRQAQLAEGPR